MLFDGSVNIILIFLNIGVLVLIGGIFLGGLIVVGEVILRLVNGLCIVYGNYGFFIWNDGLNIYFMLIDLGNSFGMYNSLRLFIISNYIGNVIIVIKLNVSGGIIGFLLGNVSIVIKL